MEEFILGEGKVLVAGVELAGIHGVLLRTVDTPREIDEFESNWKTGDVYPPEEGDVVIWSLNLAGARILQDAVSILTLKLNGRQIVDKPKAIEKKQP
jgi:hypothetical protein